jgi:hypothetical protein
MPESSSLNLWIYKIKKNIEKSITDENSANIAAKVSLAFV